MPQVSARNHRNNPYTLDRMFAQVHHSAAGSFWRFRTELGALATVTASAWELASVITLAWTLIVFGVAAMTLMAVPWTRQLVVRRAWRGWRTTGDALLALSAAARAREHRRIAREEASVA